MQRLLVRSLLIVALHLFAASPASAQVAANKFDFDIQSQSLSTALLEFARVSGVSLGFETEATANKASADLRGQYGVDEALRQMLAATDLTFTRFAGDVIRIHRRPAATASEAAPSSTPDVTARPGRPVSLLKERAFDEITAVGSRIRRSRFNEMQPVTIIDRTFIADTAAFDASDLFGLVPSAGLNSFNGIDNYFYGINDARGDVSAANLRGLGSGNSLLLLNGRRVVTHPGTQAENLVLATTTNINALPLFAIERIEILLDGASSVHGSDAVAGVINTVVANEGDRIRFGLQHGIAESTSMERTAANLQISRALADRGNVSLFAELSRETGLPAGDRPFSASSDLRQRVGDSRFRGDRGLDNRASSSAWGQFTLPSAVSANGMPITSETGLFHIQPSSLAGCLNALSPGLCVDDGAIDDSLRFDNNQYRFLLPEIDRLNLFGMGRVSLTDSVELYGEAGWYEARSQHTREPANPLSSHPITIPRDNYWNPFGPVSFDDGRSNPNRLPDIDAPAEGLPLLINTRGLGGLYKVVDAGPRQIKVDNHSDRLLLGIRSELGAWSLDGALVYNSASTDDVTHNRISSSLFQQALARDTPDAYNPFNGGDPNNPQFGDATPNDRSIIDSFLIDVGRRNETSLRLADLTMTNSDLFTVGTAAAGVSFGAEWREERFRESRDPRLNGEIGYTDIVTGRSYASDVMQSSITPDSQGSRRVFSFFGEMALPLVNKERHVPMMQSLDLNLALRFEDYSDIGKEWRPRLGLAWWLTDQWGVHVSWSEGLRAPNLPQINSAPVPRIQVARDWYRCQALINKGLVSALGACVIEAERAVQVTTTGSSDLMAETNNSTSFGLRFRSAGLGLQGSVDYWQIDQSDVVGLFGVQNHVALDYLRRLDGGNNPAVQRAPVTPQDLLLFEGSGLAPVGLLQDVDERYLNLDSRLTKGIDIAVAGDIANSPLGTVTLSLNASHLLASRQSVPLLGRDLVAANEPAIQFLGSGNLLGRNGQPRWRAAMRLAFEKGDLRYGLFGRYVGSVVDTSTIQDQTNEFLPVEDWTSFGAFAGIRIPLTAHVDGTLRLTVNNLFDTEPPLADESLGYFVGLHDAVGRSYNVTFVADMR